MAAGSGQLYFTREFLDVWKTGAAEPSRYDITDHEVESILALVCEPVEVSNQALPLSKVAESIPLEEGPELDAYIARTNAARLAELRSSGKLAEMEAKRAQQKIESAQRKVEVEERAARALAQADDMPAEGLELFTLDDKPSSASATDSAGSPAETGDATASSGGATADDFEHSTSAWDAIDKKMKARADGEAPSSS